MISDKLYQEQIIYIIHESQHMSPDLDPGPATPDYLVSRGVAIGYLQKRIPTLFNGSPNTINTCVINNPRSMFNPGHPSALDHRFVMGVITNTEGFDPVTIELGYYHNDMGWYANIRATCMGTQGLSLGS